MNAEDPRQRMHVLQLLPSLDVGGMEVVVSRLSDELIARGIRVSLGELVRPGNLPSSTPYEKRWTGAMKEHRGVLDIACHWRLWLFLVRNRFSLVHVHNPKACLYALPACILSGTPLVYTIHGSGSAQSEYDRGTGRVHRAGSRFIRHYIAVSDNALNRLVRQDRVPVGKCSVIRNGILAEPISASDHERAMARRSARTRLGIPDDSFIVGSVGRLSVEKNYPLLVEAFSMLLKRSPASGVNAAEGAGGNEPTPRLLLIGDGADKPRIQAAIRQFGVQDHCVLPGVQTDIGTWLQAMDVFCLSSDTEGTSISLLEAGAASLPSVVTDVGGNPEVVIDGESGLVVPRGDAAALCRAIARLMDSSGDRRAYGLCAARRVQAEYSMQSMADAYISVYESSVAHRCCRR